MWKITTICSSLYIGTLELAKLKQQTKMDDTIEHLEDCVKYLEEANRELKNGDFLLISWFLTLKLPIT